MVANVPSPATCQTTSWHNDFLKMLPLIERHARLAFRHLDAEASEDATSEVVASAMCMYRRLHERNELQRAFASALARFAIGQYLNGRRCGTSQNSRDVCSPIARQKAGYEIRSLGAPGEQVGAWLECLIDNRVTSIPEQVAFRMDYPRWLDSQQPRDRRIAERLSLGYSTSEVAEEFKVSAGRISQLRKQLADSWYEFINGKFDEAACDDQSGSSH